MGGEESSVYRLQHIIGAVHGPGGYQFGHLAKKFIKIMISRLVAYLVGMGINVVLTILVKDNLP